MVAFIDENEGNYNKAQDFQDERHLSRMAIERLVSKLDEVLPETQKLCNPQLKDWSQQIGVSTEKLRQTNLEHWL